MVPQFFVRTRNTIQPADIPLRENARADSAYKFSNFPWTTPRRLQQTKRGARFRVIKRLTLLLPMRLDRTCSIGSRSKRNARPRRDARNDAASIRNEVETHRGKNRPKLEVALSESESRVDLVQAKCQTYGNLLDFVRTMNASNPQNQDLISIIDDLSRTVPELATTVGATPPPQGGLGSVVPPATGSSIPNLIFDVLLSRRKLRMLDQAGRTTDRLAEASPRSQESTRTISLRRFEKC